MIMSFPGLTNHVVRVPGTDVTAYLGQWTDGPRKGTWDYCLDSESPPVDEHGVCDPVAMGSLDFSPEALGYGHHTENWLEEHFIKVTPDQVARIAFLLDVEYAS